MTGSVVDSNATKRERWSSTDTAICCGASVCGIRALLRCKRHARGWIRMPHRVRKSTDIRFNGLRYSKEEYPVWACGAVGSALPWHGRGREFESHQVHHVFHFIFNRLRLRFFRVPYTCQKRLCRNQLKGDLVG